MYTHLPRFRKPLALALALVGVAGACSRSPQAYVDRGKRFFESGKYDDAILQYQKALQKSPNFGEAHYRLALVELKKNQPVQAYLELKKAVDLMPDNQEVQASFGRLSLTLYNADPRHTREFYDQAAKTAGRLLFKNPGGFDANVLMGALAIADKKPADAVTYLQKALRAKPDDADAKLGLARALVYNGQGEEGMAKARELVEQTKSYGPAYDFLYEQYRVAGKLADAESILKLKVSNNPKQAAFILELARFYAASARPAEMTATLQKLMDSPADFPDAHQLAGDFYASIGKADDSLHQYEEGLKSAPKEKANLYHIRMARLLGAERKWPESLQHLEAILKTEPADAEAKRLRALAWIEEGKRENLDPAIAELRAQLKNAPQDAVLHYQIGTAIARKGDAGEAAKEWLLAARQNSRYLPPRFALAQTYLAQNKPDAALQVSAEILAVTPKDPSARLLDAACLTAAKQADKARTELNALATDFPTSAQVQFRLGILDLTEKKYQEAEAIFRKLEGAIAGDPSILAGLAQAYEGENESGKGLQMLEAEVNRNPNAPILRRLLARFAMASKNYDVAIEQYRQLAAQAPKSAEMQVYLASAYQAKGDLKSAGSSFENAAQLEPKSIPASFALAQFYMSTKRLNEAKARFRYVLTLEPNNDLAMNDLAYLMADNGENLDEALAFAQRCQQHALAPQLKMALDDTLGWIYVKKGLYDRAIATLQPLVRDHPENATFHYHLATALFQKGDKPGARSQLQSALQNKPSPDEEPKIRELLART